MTDLPQSGGSFVRDPNKGLKKVAGTAPPKPAPKPKKSKPQAEDKN